MTRATLRMAGVCAVVLTAGLAASGCATKGYVKDKVAVVDTRVGQVDTHLTAVEGTASDALARATAAGKLAEGKFLYEVVLNDDSVKFPKNRYELSPEAKARLDELAQRLKSENKNVYLEIQGHTDASGPDESNEKLGEERAEAVRRYLNSQGVALNRMSVISYGEEAPVAPNETAEGRSQNRRVAIVVLS